MIPEQGWQCPICKRVYSPRQEMCLYCGGEEKKQTVDWISTNPCHIDTTKGQTNIPSGGTKNSPYYTTTTGSIDYNGPVQEVVLGADQTIKPTTTLCSAYNAEDKTCLGVKEPFISDCGGRLEKCTEY